MRLFLYLAAMIFSCAAILPRAYAQQAPGQNTITFNPPVDQTLYMNRIITRETRAEPVVKATRHQLKFARLGRGYTLEMRLVDINVTGPEEISRLLAFGDRLISDEILVFTIGPNGEIVNVKDAAGSYDRMRTAITAIQAEVAASDSSAMAKVMHNSFLSKMANMDQAAHQEFLIGAVRPILQFAGRQLNNGSLIAGDKLTYNYNFTPDNGLVQFAFEDENGSTSSFTVSAKTGVTYKYSRKTVVDFGGLTRITQDDAIIMGVTVGRKTP